MLIAHCVAKGLNNFPAYLVKEFIVALINSVLCVCICHEGQVSRPRGWMVAFGGYQSKKINLLFMHCLYTGNSNNNNNFTPATAANCVTDGRCVAFDLCCG